VKVLVTGVSGQVGQSLLQSVPAGIDVLAIDRTRCDLAAPDQCRAVVDSLRPDVVVNAAAYTQVDRAEAERALAFTINADAPAAMAKALAGRGGRLIQVSTDFVFDGRQTVPYQPGAATHPLNAYGASKLAGEEAVLAQLGHRGVVLRTAWVHSSHGANFVKTMLRLMSTRDQVAVVHDQQGSPTWARSVAQALWAAVLDDRVSGIHHWTDAGVVSWHGFAVAIQQEARARGLLRREVPVVPITAADYQRQFPASVPRPAFSVLDTQATARQLGLQANPWQSNLGKMLDELKA
jgi:dTDP-4-dehydrorhamnose reductase